MMTDEAMTEWRAGLRYRILYGFACRYLDPIRFGTDTYTREDAKGVPAEDILAEVVRVAKVDRQDLNAMQLARESVEDAREGRRPRW